MRTFFLTILAVSSITLAAAQTPEERTTTNVVLDTGVFYTIWDDIPERPVIDPTQGAQPGINAPRAIISGTLNHWNQYEYGTLNNAQINAVIPFDAYGTFYGANLRNADITVDSEAQDAFYGADLTGANINSTISGVYAFRNANLTQASLQGTIGDGLDGGAASFYGTNLTGANVSATFNTRPNFWDPFLFANANLQNTNFSGSTGLRASYFTNASNLTGANFTGTGITRMALLGLGNPHITEAMLDSMTF